MGMNDLHEYLEDPEKALSLEGEELEEMWKVVRGEYDRLKRECEQARNIIRGWENPENDPHRTAEINRQLAELRAVCEEQEDRIADAEFSYLNEDDSAGFLYGALDRLVDDWYGGALRDVEWPPEAPKGFKQTREERWDQASSAEELLEMILEDD